MSRKFSRKQAGRRNTPPAAGGQRRESATPPAKSLREQLAERLPDMLTAALAAYDAIALPGPEAADPRALGAQQNAARAALKHVEMILKLAESILPPETEDTKETEKAALLAAARAALARDYPDETPGNAWDNAPEPGMAEAETPEQHMPGPIWPPPETRAGGP